MRLKFGLAGLVAVMAASAQSQSLNTYGNVGIIDVPSAQTSPDGTVAFSYSALGSSTGRATINFQLAPRIEGSLRYSSIDGFSTPGVTRSDRQFDFKFTLLEETAARPSLAIGFRDFLGSAIYSSEYLVATKEVMPGLRLSGGLGWGRLASRAAFDNPFGGTRSNAPGGVERVNGANFFRGADVGLFGGVEYQAPGSKWRFKADYSSDDYQREAANGGYDPQSPWSFGLERELIAGVDAGVYAMQGREIGLRISFSADPREPRVPQDLLSGPQPFIGRPATAKKGTSWTEKPELQDQIMIALSEALAGEGLIIEQARLSANEADVHVTNTRYSRSPKAVGRVARILAAGMPSSVERFNITLVENALPTATVVVTRSDLERLVDTHEAVPESYRLFDVRNAADLDGATFTRNAYPEFTWSVSPKVPFSLFGGDFNFDLLVAGAAKYQVTPEFSISGEVTQSLLGRLKTVTSTAAGLPRVRSNYAAYQTDVPQVERLTADYVTKLGDEIYLRGTAGYLERMFAGVSGEVLWKDVNSPLAYGLELNYARQRDPGKVFGVNDYDTVTGFGSVYWDTGWNGVYAQVDAGRYLAGDWGATMTLSRRFENGWEVAGYVTGTDADTAGSSTGAFDKGLRLTIPLQWTMPGATRRKLTVPFADLARDDGARLNIDNRLYTLVRDVDRARLRDNWGSFWQ